MKPMRVLAAVSLVLASAALAGPATPPNPAPPLADMREPAPRTAVEKASILEQMRLLVASIQAISEGLATDHMEDVVEAAAARGLRRNANDPNYPASMKAKETPLWKQMGGGTRRGFDQLADAAQNGASKEKLLGILA